jgi:hypothetical protein
MDERVEVVDDALVEAIELRSALAWKRDVGPHWRQEVGGQQFCDNLVFHRRAALEKLGERLLDANRAIGQPDKLTTILTPQGHQELSRQAPDRDRQHAPAQPSPNNVTDYGLDKAVGNLPALRRTLSAINDNDLDVQQDILETFVDRGQLQRLAQPTISATGKRPPRPEAR